MFGIDISRYQKGLKLAELKPEFVIIKATESTNWTDPECDGFYQQAKSLGIPRGVYHFARNGTNKGMAGAVREADYFLSQVQGYVKDGILVLDWEDPNGNKAEVSWAKAWLDRVYEKTGVRALIYMSSSVMNAADWSSVASDYGLWVAAYGVNNGKQNAKPSVKWWSFYAMWQYTSVNGRYPQWSGGLDCNEFYGDAGAWSKYANASNEQTNNNDNSSNDGKENMAMMQVDTATYEMLVGKATKYDAFVAAGYNTADDVKNKVNQLQQDKTNIENERNSLKSQLDAANQKITQLQNATSQPTETVPTNDVPTELKAGGKTWVLNGINRDALGRLNGNYKEKGT